MLELYKVVIFYPDDYHETVAHELSAEQAVKLAKDYTLRPAAELGILRKVMITDSDDCCAFLWEQGKGVVFPQLDG